MKLTVYLGKGSAAIEEAARQQAAAKTIIFPELEGVSQRPRHPCHHAMIAREILVWAGPIVVCTHSDAMVLAWRRCVVDGILKPEDIELFWIGKNGFRRSIRLNERGTPDWWPQGVGAEPQEEFKAIRRALNARDRA